MKESQIAKHKVKNYNNFMLSNVYNVLHTRLLVYFVINLAEIRYFLHLHIFVLACAVAMKIQTF